MRPLHLRTHNGFGDVIYVRPAVKEFARQHPGDDIYLATAWPEMFADLPVRFIRAQSGLVWSNRNMAGYQGFHDKPSRARTIDLRVRDIKARMRHESMPDLMAMKAGVKVSAYDLPELPASPVREEMVAVIRPVTVRSDFPHPARNPNPEYMREAAELLRVSGFHVVSVGGIDQNEPYLGEPPFAHERFDRGELGSLELLALVRHAAVVVSGPGWAIPAAQATGTPLIAIGGGAGGTNGPAALVPPWYAGPVTWLSPDRYCPCLFKRHDCDKTITHFARRFSEALLAGVAR